MNGHSHKNRNGNQADHKPPCLSEAFVEGSGAALEGKPPVAEPGVVHHQRHQVHVLPRIGPTQGQRQKNIKAQGPPSVFRGRASLGAADTVPQGAAEAVAPGPVLGDSNEKQDQGKKDELEKDVKPTSILGPKNVNDLTDGAQGN